MRKVMFFLLGFLLLASCSGNTYEKGGAAMGDTVLVEYVGKFQNGTVFDTNVQSIAEANGIQKQNYQPLEITIGKGQVIKGFENALIGMAEGEEKTITLQPIEAYGREKKGQIVSVDKETKVSRFSSYQRDITLPIERFNQLPENASEGEVVEVGDIAYEVISVGEEEAELRLDVEAGDLIRLPNTAWNSTIVEVNKSSYRVRQDPNDGQVVQTAFGPARLDVSEEEISRILLAEKGSAVRTQQGVGRITNVTDSKVVVDFNHPLAGKELTFDIKLVGYAS